jgi:hypothetical protein
MKYINLVFVLLVALLAAACFNYDPVKVKAEGDAIALERAEAICADHGGVKRVEMYGGFLETADEFWMYNDIFCNKDERPWTYVRFSAKEASRILHNREKEKGG